MTKLNGKTAVITGGATGIGRAAAKRFIEEGAFVFIFGRRQEALDAALSDLGPNVRAVKGSVSDLADLDRLYAAVEAERGTLDIVFANAGAGSQLPLGEITVESGKRAVARTNGDRTRGGSARRGRHEGLRLAQSAQAHGRPRGDRSGGCLPRVAGQQLHDRQRGRRRRRPSANLTRHARPVTPFDIRSP
jgi:NAD(P)-dependent dehydrogenase (short-subunit alcohol dehydrogenase family)